MGDWIVRVNGESRQCDCVYVDGKVCSFCSWSCLNGQACEWPYNGMSFDKIHIAIWPRRDTSRIWILYAKHWKRPSDIRTPTDLYYYNFTLKATNHLVRRLYAIKYNRLLASSFPSCSAPAHSYYNIIGVHRNLNRIAIHMPTLSFKRYDLTSQNAIYSPFNMLSPSNHIHSIISIFNHINWMAACLRACAEERARAKHRMLSHAIR